MVNGITTKVRISHSPEAGGAAKRRPPELFRFRRPERVHSMECEDYMLPETIWLKASRKSAAETVVVTLASHGLRRVTVPLETLTDSIM